MQAAICASRPIFVRSLRTFLPLPASQSRTYAISRFPERRPGVSRKRETFNPKEPAARIVPNAVPREDSPSVESSPLWQESIRPVSGNPELGLSKLLMTNETLVVTRQIEMLNIFIGFEQANKYAITTEEGEPLGYIAEEPRGLLSSLSRQVLRTHRPFRAIIMDSEGTPILWLRRPFSWINSRMFVQRLKDFHDYTPEGEPVLDTFAEVQQRWHIYRRRYDLFLRQESRRILTLASEPQPEPGLDSYHQFAKIDEGLFAWHFTLRDGRGDEVASVNRAFRGFGREIFTDTGRYNIRFTPQLPDVDSGETRTPSIIRDLKLEERALALATAVNIDFDYFSRHSEGGGLGMPMFFGGSGE